MATIPRWRRRRPNKGWSSANGLSVVAFFSLSLGNLCESSERHFSGFDTRSCSSTGPSNTLLLANSKIGQSQRTCWIVSGSPHVQNGSSSISMTYRYCFNYLACPALSHVYSDRTVCGHSFSTSYFGFLLSRYVSFALSCETDHFLFLTRACAMSWVTGISAWLSLVPSFAN